MIHWNRCEILSFWFHGNKMKNGENIMVVWSIHSWKTRHFSNLSYQWWYHHNCKNIFPYISLSNFKFSHQFRINPYIQFPKIYLRFNNARKDLWKKKKEELKFITRYRQYISCTRFVFRRSPIFIDCSQRYKSLVNFAANKSQRWDNFFMRSLDNGQGLRAETAGGRRGG